MSLNAFLFSARATWQKAPKVWPSELELMHAALGLAGETGDVVDIIKKDVFTPGRLEAKGLRMEDALAEELGDVLYYWCRICDMMNFDPDTIMARTLAKLRERYHNTEEAA